MRLVSESVVEASQRVVSLDRGAGVRLVQGGGSSSSSGPAVPEHVEESALVKKLVAPSAPTAADQEEHTASGHAVFRTGGRESAILAIAIDYGYLNERDDQLQGTAGASIWG